MRLDARDGVILAGLVLLAVSCWLVDPALALGVVGTLLILAGVKGAV